MLHFRASFLCSVPEKAAGDGISAGAVREIQRQSLLFQTDLAVVAIWEVPQQMKYLCLPHSPRSVTLPLSK